MFETCQSFGQQGSSELQLLLRPTAFASSASWAISSILASSGSFKESGAYPRSFFFAPPPAFFLFFFLGPLGVGLPAFFFFFSVLSSSGASEGSEPSSSSSFFSLLRPFAGHHHQNLSLSSVSFSVSSHCFHRPKMTQRHSEQDLTAQAACLSIQLE